MGWSEEEAAQLMDKLIASSDFSGEVELATQLEKDIMGRTGYASMNEIRECCPQLYELIAAQGLVREGMEAERICNFDVLLVGRIRSLFQEENLETIKAILALGMYRQAERILPKEGEDTEPMDFNAFLSFAPRVLDEQVFVHDLVPQERIDLYRQLVDEYKEAMRVRIGQNSRLSEESKKAALRKIDAMIGSEILYPYGEMDFAPLLEDLRSCENLLEANGTCRQLERQERFRVNFTLAHFDEFYQTYPSVTEGTPMYIAPEDRVLPW